MAAAVRWAIFISTVFTSASTIFNVQGMSPSPATSAEAQTYVAGHNTAVNSSVYVESGSYTNATCTTASLAMAAGRRTAYSGKPAGLSAPLNQAVQLPVAAASPVVNASFRGVVAASTVSDTVKVTLGDLPAGKKLTVTFDVRVADPLSQGTTYVDNQVQLGGDNFGARLSDDPSTPAANDPTRTLLYRPPSTPLAVNDGYNTGEDTVLAVAAPGVLGNDSDPAGDKLMAKLDAGPTHGDLSLGADGSLVFTPTLNYNGQITFTYRANDWVVDSDPAVVTLTVQAVNDAPVLHALWPATFNSIHEDDLNNSGTLVAELISASNGSQIIDVDSGAKMGMAVVAANTLHGAWQFNTGTGWRDLGSPSNSAARLLAADQNTRLRFQPHAGWDGLLTPAITFRIWDQTSGSNADVAGANPNGGATAFSLATNTANIQVLKSADLAVAVEAQPAPVMAGALLTYTLMVTNTGPSEASSVRITDTIPAGAVLAAASGGCGQTGDLVACSIGDLGVGHSAQRWIAVTAPITGEMVSLNQVQVSGAEFDPDQSNNRASVQVPVVSRVVAFEFDNDTPPGDEWSRPVTTTSPAGETFLGEFGNEDLVLNLENLPSHEHVAVSFDLYLLRSWDGNQIYSTDDMRHLMTVGTVIGPDKWQLKADDATLLNTTFANWPTFHQSFPQQYPDGDYVRGAGASVINDLGYTFDAEKMDSGYRLAFSFDHTASTLKLDFSASGLQDISDESWGIGNVKITVSTSAKPLGFSIYIPVATHY